MTSFEVSTGYKCYLNRDLNGCCDFILPLEAPKLEITATIFCVAELKGEKIDKGLAQRGAEMYVARIFNERKGNDIKIIYGALTNGFMWQFLKLEEQTL